MSGTTSITGPTQCCGSFFYDNAVTVAAALDMQNALQSALPAALSAVQNAQAAQQLSAQAVASANYFLTGDLRGLPTAPDGLSVGTLWNNGGALALVTA